MTELTREIAEGVQAALRNPAIAAAFDALEADAAQQWAATALSDHHNREIYYFQLLGLRQLRQQLQNWSRETKGTGDR